MCGGGGGGGGPLALFGLGGVLIASSFGVCSGASSIVFRPLQF